MNVVAPVDDDVEVTCEIIDLGDTLTTAEPSISFFSLKDGTVDLKSGNYERWIDRVILPDYAMDFYDLLVEGSDYDGKNDFLIDESYFEKNDTTITIYTDEGYDIFNGIPVCQYTNESDGDYVAKAIRAVYDAFDRDHPEVFWLDGATQISTIGKGSAGEWEYTVYFLLKVFSSDDGPFDIRAAQYQSNAAITRDIKKRNSQVAEILDTVTSSNAGEQIQQLNQ